MTYLAWICIGIGLWNFIIYHITPLDKAPFNIPHQFPYSILSTLTIISVIFFLSSKKIKYGHALGKHLAQFAILALYLSLMGFVFYGFSHMDLPLNNNTPFKIMFTCLYPLFIFQFGIPAFFAIRYIGKFPDIPMQKK